VQTPNSTECKATSPDRKRPSSRWESVPRHRPRTWRKPPLGRERLYVSEGLQARSAVRWHLSPSMGWFTQLSQTQFAMGIHPTPSCSAVAYTRNAAFAGYTTFSSTNSAGSEFRSA
jgi:hypothetical protein